MINERLDLVSQFVDTAVLRHRIVTILKKTSDTLRLAQKFSFGRGDADDLLGLARTIGFAQQIGLILHEQLHGLQQETSREDVKGGDSSNMCFSNIIKRLDFVGPS